MSRISVRAVLVSLGGAAVIGGVAVAGMASATAPAQPAVDSASARFVAPSGDTRGAFTFAADVADDSGIEKLTVLAWPKASGLDVTAEEMERVEEDAVCERVDEEKSTCAYTLRITEREAAEMERGEWTVSALLTARDGGKRFVPEAATVTLDF
ncbi:DUF5707 domain-containing protein [Streptomyces sp. NBC_01725]|uniref:DUF5707 domain-containing protein n=1 Tax=Streptomyces sp. NBC_01725 TaxID=2975923 RepID=UPI002E2AABDA|nr:DUF5707 domain-containing protein [Streptomyces sp. NBC_01725]